MSFFFVTLPKFPGLGGSALRHELLGSTLRASWLLEKGAGGGKLYE